MAINSRELVFYTGLAFLFTHELDAMPNHEWRVLPVTSFLSDSVGMNTFLIAHIPIFAVVIGCIASLNLKTRWTAQNIASGFLIAHAVLHFAFSGHSDYEFESVISSVLIYGAAVFGILFFVLKEAERSRNP